MRSYITVLASLFCSLSLLAQSPYEVTFVNRQAANGFNPEKVYLFSLADKAAIDSAACVDGVYTLKGRAELPMLASICGTSTGYNVVAAFVLDDTPVRVTLDRGIMVEGSDVNARMAAITAAIGNLTRQSRRSAIYFCNIFLKPIIGKRYGIGIKCIGFNYIGTCINICRMNIFYDFGTCQHQQIVTPFHGAMPPCKTVATKIRLGQPLPLNHSTHGTIEHHYAFPHRR